MTRTTAMLAALLAASALRAEVSAVSAASAAVPDKAKEAAKPAAEAPASPWKTELVGNASASQAYFSNWRSGGVDALNWQAGILGSLIRDTAHANFTGTFKADYGMTRLQYDEPRKSADDLKLDLLYVRKLTQYVNPFAAGTAQSQFTEGWDYSGDTPTVVSKFMDPGYFTESVGVGTAAGEWFSTRVGAAARQVVTDHYNKYADDPDTAAVEKFKNEYGASWVTRLKVKPMDSTLFTSDLETFSNLKATDQVVVRWANMLSLQVNKYFSTNLAVELLYDKTVSTQRQLKEMLNMGVTYSFL